PGTTVEKKVGITHLGGRLVEFIDLPGIYSLKAVTPEEQLACDILRGKTTDVAPPDLAVVIADADNLERSLFVASQLLELDLPVVVALNMIDVAERHGLHIKPEALSIELGCPVIPMIARTGQGVDELKVVIDKTLRDTSTERIPITNPT